MAPGALVLSLFVSLPCPQQLDPVISQYRDRRFEGSQEAFEVALRTSTTVYVGNLSFFTTEEQIYEVTTRNSAQ